MKNRLFDLMNKINPESNKEILKEDSVNNSDEINNIVSPESHYGYSVVFYNGKTGKGTKWLKITKEQLLKIKDILGGKESSVPNYADFSMNENKGAFDPTKEQMYRRLKINFGSEFDDFSAEEAIYWFCYDYHNGQSSNMYSALSTSQYKPSPLMNSSDEMDDLSKSMYDELVAAYT